MKLLQQAREARAAAQTALDALLASAESETRSADFDEAAFDVAFAAKVAEIRGLDTRIVELTSAEELRTKGAEQAAHVAPAVVGGEAQVYSGANDGPSYLRDLWHSSRGDSQARDRLVRSQVEREREGRVRPAEQRAGVTTVATAGGEFAPPLYAEDQWIALARAGRPTANLLGSAPLPLGYQSIIIPAITAGTAVANVTGSQNTALTANTITTAFITAPVQTIAGGAAISQQLLDQSPVNPDTIVLADLAAAYATAVDVAAIKAISVGGADSGGTGTVSTFTSGAPTTAGTTPANSVNDAVINAVQLLHSNRFRPATAIIMTPKRWANFTAATDTTGRPLVVPNSSPAFNAFGVGSADAAENFAGVLYGLPVYLDASIPTNFGAGTNQDRIYVIKADDVLFMEGDLHVDAFPQTLANQMSVFVRVFAYSAFAVKQSKGSYYVDGTGLTPLAIGA